MSSEKTTREKVKDDAEKQEEVEPFYQFAGGRQLPRTPTKPIKPVATSTPAGTSYIRETLITPPPSEQQDSSQTLSGINTIGDNTVTSDTRSELQTILNPRNPIISEPAPLINFSLPNNAEINMANEPNRLLANQTVSLKDALKVVPEFNGANSPLTPFLHGCDEALAMIDPTAEANLVKLIRSKLTGEARTAITGYQFMTIEEFKNFLKNIYFASKTVYQLQGELGNTYQKENESVISFANRIREIGTKIVETYRYENNPNEVSLATFKASTENNIIECFKRGLRPEIEDRLENANTVKDIVKNAIRAEREVLAKLDLRNEKPIKINHEFRGRKIHRVQQESEESSDEEPEFSLKLAKTKAALPLRPDRCQICNSTGHIAYNCEFYRCSKCEKPGHHSSNCRVKGFNTAKKFCQICRITGHATENCSKLACANCGEPGHISRECPDLKRLSKLRCDLCLRYAHEAHHCQEAVAEAGIYPTTTQAISKPPTVCQLCKGQGHEADRCPTAPKNQPKVFCQYSGKPAHEASNCWNIPKPVQLVKCQYCDKTGHDAKECYSIKNLKPKDQARPVDNYSCRYCKEKGHTIEYCKKRQLRNQNQENDQKPLATSGQEGKSAAIRSFDVIPN